MAREVPQKGASDRASSLYQPRQGTPTACRKQAQDIQFVVLEGLPQVAYDARTEAGELGARLHVHT